MVRGHTQTQTQTQTLSYGRIDDALSVALHVVSTDRLSRAHLVNPLLSHLDDMTRWQIFRGGTRHQTM